MLKYASITDVGNRKCNEDCLKISSVSNRHCFVVCDGLGGHDRGDIASKIAGDSFVNELSCCNDLTSFLVNAFADAQKQIATQKQDMKTTAVCMATDEQKIYVGHVGDSRFYGFKKDGSYMQTADHSVVQLLVQSNTITQAEIRNHPNRNLLLKVLGDDCDDEPVCELSEPLPISEFSAFLLCTDGFWELITEDDMMNALQNSDSPQAWLDKMIAIVKANGKDKDMDNFTAITVFA